MEQETTHVEEERYFEEVEYEIENQLEIGMVPKLMLEDSDKKREDMSLLCSQFQTMVNMI